MYQYKFKNLEQLKYEFEKYFCWYNNDRIYSSLAYLSPI
ncbi:IS3 family transposase [Miniphocaeibacter sp.]|nr:transposase [Gallicola sp.]